MGPFLGSVLPCCECAGGDPPAVMLLRGGEGGVSGKHTRGASGWAYARPVPPRVRDCIVPGDSRHDCISSSI